MKSGLLLLILAALLTTPSSLWAQEPDARPRGSVDPLTRKLPLVIADGLEHLSSADCGLYCFLANAKCYGRDVDLSALFSAKYINGAFGSSVEDLLACSRDFGFRAESFSNLNILDLWLLERPVLVLVKNTLDGKVYNHWVLVLGVDSEGVTLLDPSAYHPTGDLAKVPIGQFLSVWGGITSVIIPEHGDFVGYKVARLASITVEVLALFGLTLLFYSARSAFGPRFQWLWIPIFATGVAVPYHLLLPNGFAANTDQLRVLITARRENAPHINVDDVIADSAERRRPLLIDVRYPDAFRVSHIPGAVSVPVTSSDLAFLASLRNVARDTPIVIYCQSEHCPWATASARRRLFDSFSSVSVLEGGMQAYLQFVEGLRKSDPKAVAP